MSQAGKAKGKKEMPESPEVPVRGQRWSEKCEWSYIWETCVSMLNRIKKGGGLTSTLRQGERNGKHCYTGSANVPSSIRFASM